mmetsp:Transcript_16869/g.41496  ORF Transcript_16869/g.41496 Transcript_16869/m.41496 type:complete len:122 (-) Transcript_16869:259-624(-)
MPRMTTGGRKSIPGLAGATVQDTIEARGIGHTEILIRDTEIGIGIETETETETVTGIGMAPITGGVTMAALRIQETIGTEAINVSRNDLDIDFGDLLGLCICINSQSKIWLRIRKSLGLDV